MLITLSLMMCCSLINIFYIDLVGDSSTSSNDTLLLLHGFPTSSVDFKGPFMWRLQPEFARIISLDYPGKGCFRSTMPGSTLAMLPALTPAAPQAMA